MTQINEKQGKSEKNESLPAEPKWEKIGGFELIPLNIGDITLPLGELIIDRGQSSDADRKNIQEVLNNQRIVPMQDFLIRGHGTTILVDAGSYASITSESEYAIQGYTPPAPLLAQLEDLGVDPLLIDHVIFTHTHWDHFNGATFLRDQKYIPAFPNARHYISKTDWESVRQEMLVDNSEEANVFPALIESNLLDIVDGELEILPGVTIFSAPGETRGHQIARFQSNGETFYTLGDLYHHPIEVTHGDWMAVWADEEASRNSRKVVLNRAAQESARVMTSHIKGVGRIVLEDSEYRWEPC
ncbi:MBL fold metallo-hydrolase [Paracoccus aminophilus]|uniref:Metallo-beta-lactamase domain-containing protein n=1 Tax=Paracoccus aminophilus JCM 7686 TaxID=1367847 RepID=S5Y5K8_PARAH|nr:MBL fold metallo-hydrolase [Paracoccus aminophilus]AGT11000.1 hypothetical protein JCM7686_pAMI4p312 [Paracoccus aminophilus JCM 7686]